MKSADEQLHILAQGTEQVVSPAELKTKLGKGTPLRVKLGCDPTAPDLHLGHAVVLRKLRQFQDLGHKAILIIGDYTARVGDPTGQNKTRPVLNENDIQRNAQTYFDQAGKILDTSPDKLEIRRNSEWLGAMSFADVIRLASQMTVAQMLERDTFEQRTAANEPIGVHEFLYPLMQGHDSVMIRADVELGGTDQLFNNLVGRQLQKDAGQESQVVMILPILVGTDGVEKMSKSKGNYIGLNDTAKDMFGKTMSISDETMAKWYPMLLDRSVQGHPMQAKKTLAQAIVERYHGAASGQLAVEEFDQQFSKRNLAQIARLLPVSLGTIWIVDLVERAHLFKSRSDVRRLIQQGGVSIDGRKITDDKAHIDVQNGQILKVGKLVAVKLTVS